ncbi:MAG TPA: hypothetical protein VIL37_03365 [Natronosporangium sp.]
MSAGRRLLIVCGLEGAGKSTIVRALLPHTPNGARIDGEDVAGINPCPFDEPFFDLLRRNVAGLVRNFWEAGYRNVIAGSFIRNEDDLRAFQALIPKPAGLHVIELLVAKQVRDVRRATRAKQTTQEWRDQVDLVERDARTIREPSGDYRYVAIDTTQLDVPATVDRIRAAIPEVYGA